tara:strand:- start:1278 stop:2135 length:858 start_codon:yes stop_codon:yes gene_type:complete
MERGEQSRLETLVAGEESRLDQLEASEAAKIDTMQRQELGDIDRQERAGAERLQANKKNAALQISMAKAQAQQGINMAEASYAGQIDAMQRGETSRLDTLKAGEAARLDDRSRDWTGRMDEQIAGRDIFTSDRTLDTDLQLDLAKRGADMELQKLYAEGDIYTQGLEMDRVTTLLSGALGVDASRRNARAQRSASKTGALGTVAGAAVGAMIPSDRKIKRDIKLVGKSPSGLNIYTFKYKDWYLKDNDTYQGVMSDEVPKHAVIRGDKYDKVDYSKIDVDFKTIN